MDRLGLNRNKAKIMNLLTAPGADDYGFSLRVVLVWLQENLGDYHEGDQAC
jgi:hypothetical protein